MRVLLTKKTTVKISDEYSNIIGHMGYASYKLWNVCNYERRNYKELGLSEYPDWYYQKKAHKDDIWYKQLPSQTAQEVCKLLDKSWKSFYSLLRSKGIKNPNPPRFKQDKMAFTYMQNGMVHEKNSSVVRLTLSKQLKRYMSDTYGIHDNYLFLENEIFKDMDIIKQIRIYPPVKNEIEIIVVYETKDVQLKEDNGKYLSIDLGLHNLFTCYDSTDGTTFIVGRKYLSLCHFYSKEIARVQSQWSSQQSSKGIEYPKSSKHIQKLYEKKNNSIHDYLHKVTRYIVNYCIEKDIHTVVIGDIKGIRKDSDLGKKTNQKLHSLPYSKIYQMLEYKLNVNGIQMIRQKETYSSQCSPLSPDVSKEYAKKSNRIKRGLYKDGDHSWNADVVGAYNILRLFQHKNEVPDPLGIRTPYIAKVAV